MRPSILQVGGTFYWVIYTRNPDTMVLNDADSDPTVSVRKNGASVGDSVTVTKRSATTGIYDCSYNPAAEAEGDSFTFEETAVVTGTTTVSATYKATWAARVVALERGTDVATIKSTVRREVEWYNGINRWPIYGDAALVVPGTGDSNMATFPSVVLISGVYHCFYSSGSGSIRHVSLGADGKTVGGTRTTVLTPVSGVDGVYAYSPVVRVDGSTLKMWYSCYLPGFLQIQTCYATATIADPLTWIKGGIVIAPGDAPDYVRGCVGCCGVNKIGSTYYLYGTTDLIASTLDASGVIPKNYSDRRAFIATSSTGIGDWTFHPLLSKTDDPSYADEYLHLISCHSFSYTVNGELRHYLLAATAGSGSDFQQLQLFESCDPLFPENATQHLGAILTTNRYGESWPTNEIDVYSVVTPISGLLDASAEVKIYFGGKSKDGANQLWSIGLMTQPTPLEAIRPPYRSIQDMQPNLLRQMVERNVDGELQFKEGAAVLDSASQVKLDLLLAAAVGVSSQPSATEEKFKFVDGEDAFTTTFDTSGNRTSVVLH